MTDRAEIETRVKKVLAEQLAVDEAQVVPDARFAEDLNADSLDLVEAVLALEEEWSIEIPEEEMEQVKTVGAADRPRRDEARRRLTGAASPRGATWRNAAGSSITGIGPVTPVGTGVDDFWAGLTSGRNGVRTIHALRPDDLPVTVAGEVAGLRRRPTASTPRRSAAPTGSCSSRSRRRSSRGRTPAQPEVRLGARRRDLRDRDRRHPDAAATSTSCCWRRDRAASRRSWCRC